MRVGTAGGGGCHHNDEGGSIERGVKMVDRGLSSLPMECEFPQGATSGQLYGLGAKLLLYDIDLILYKY